jgi:hypothetical protein
LDYEKWCETHPRISGCYDEGWILPFSRDDIFVIQTKKWKQGVTGWHHYNTFWVCNFHLQLNISCKRHMWSTTYELLNPCGFTHLVVRDNDVAFFCKV